MKRFLQGIRISTPFPDIRFWERLNPATNEISMSLTLTAQQIPTTYTHQMPREASPTGKSGIGIATFSQPPQPIFLARRKTVLPVMPNMRAGHLNNTGYVDPYATITKQKQSKLNLKWQG